MARSALVPLALLASAATLLAGALAAQLAPPAGAAGLPGLPFDPRPSWPQFGYDTAHTGHNTLEHVIGPDNVAVMTQKWKIPSGGTGLGGGVQAQITVAAGVAYVNGQEGTVRALDARTGALLWKTNLIGYGDSAPAIGDGLVYVAAVNGLFALPTLCATPCPPLWNGDAGMTINPSPVLAGGRLYCSAYSGHLDILDAATGALLASPVINENDPIFGPPAVAGGRLFVPGDFGLRCFPADCTGDCTPLWMAPSDFSLERSPAVADGVVYVASTQGRLYALDVATGAPLWVAQTSFLPSSPAVADGVVYIATSDGTLWAFDAHCTSAHCQPLWTTNVGAKALFDPVVANGVIYVGALDGIYTKGVLYAFPADCGSGCTPLWSRAVDGAIEAAPTVVGGRVYAGTITGAVYCFGLP